MLPSRRVLVCKHCRGSVDQPARDVPERCPHCRQPAHWQVVGDWTLTPMDRSFLKSIKVKVD